MLSAVAENPELHIASFDQDFRGKNHFVPGSDHYYLSRGDKDPSISIMSARDRPKVQFTAEDARRANAKIKEMLSGPEVEAELLALRARFETAKIKLEEKRQQIATRKIQ